MKRISKLDENVVKRPAKSTDQIKWNALRQQRRDLQRLPSGAVHCGTCWATEGDGHHFELHHRHYNTFGEESLQDVILLCVPCHDAITDRIRSARHAAGDLTIEAEAMPETKPRFIPTGRKVCSVNAEEAPSLKGQRFISQKKPINV